MKCRPQSILYLVHDLFIEIVPAKRSVRSRYANQQRNLIGGNRPSGKKALIDGWSYQLREFSETDPPVW
jgi:hypothetical protein